jgi:hypothetical protein
LGGIQQDEARPGHVTRDESLVFATPQIGAGGDPDAVALNARVVHFSEGDGPASSSVEFLESGPVVVP